MIYIYLLFITSVCGYTMYMKYPRETNWNKLQNSMKDSARGWFINRAVDRGISWFALYDKNEKQLEGFKEEMKKKEDRNLFYPEYYTKPFHGYNEGNLNWKAALEAEAATLSIAAGYWKGVNPYEASSWMRQNISENIKSYVDSVHDMEFQIERCFPRKVLDIGCSTGISTYHLKESMPPNTTVYGIDLSPFFISVASYESNKNKLNITYVHGNAEKMSFLDGTFDLIVCNFMFHELPDDAASNVIKEMFRVLSDKGIVAVVDIDPKNLNKQLNNNVFRKWAFEITEPHVYSYYKRDMFTLLNDCGFTNVQKMGNDPLNSIWLGTKEQMWLRYLEIAKTQKINKRNNDYDGVAFRREIVST